MSEGYVEWEGHRTWYRLVGDIHDARPPLVICHGGPGITHDYLGPVARLADHGRPCILYDQIGNGRSDHLPDAPSAFWTVDLFLRELRALVKHLDLEDGHHVLGQSWGGMLALEYAFQRPAGLQSLVLADALASMPTYIQEVDRLVAALPPEIREPLRRHEEAGTTDDPAYREAVVRFYERHLLRVSWPEALPDHVRRTFAAARDDPTVYGTMVGPSEFHVTGTLRDWDITDRLGEIAVPALLISGRHDEVTPKVVAELHEGLPNSEWVLFENSSHMPHVEETDRFLEVVGSFLSKADPGATDA